MPKISLYPLVAVAAGLLIHPCTAQDEPTLSAAEADAIVETEAVARAARERLRARPRFDVLDTRTVVRDGRPVTFSRTAPPAFPDRGDRRIDPESPAVRPRESDAATVPDPDTPREYRLLSLSATVFDRRITRLSWTHDERRYVAWSPVDFNLLSSVTDFRDGDTAYSLHFGIGNERAGDHPEMTIPETAATPGTIEYLLVLDPEKPPPPEEAVAGIDAIHRFFAANESSLRAALRRRDALNEARARFRETHPPPPEDRVIHYWPRKNSAYLQAGESTTSDDTPRPTIP